MTIIYIIALQTSYRAVVVHAESSTKCIMAGHNTFVCVLCVSSRNTKCATAARAQLLHAAHWGLRGAPLHYYVLFWRGAKNQNPNNEAIREDPVEPWSLPFLVNQVRST